MKTFRVSATKTVPADPPPRNPFICRIEDMGRDITTTRTWTFEATSKAAVRLLWMEAQASGEEKVRGFQLGLIEEIGGGGSEERLKAEGRRKKEETRAET